MTVRVLLVEDLPSDATLVSYALRTGGLVAEIEVVADREGFLEGLRHQPDVVLCDHSLPSFSAKEALSLLQQRASPVPLIVVSGVLPDEVAAGLLAHGASDYLLKDRLSRLPAAVRTAVDRARLEHDVALHRDLAMRDALTGLANRAALDQALLSRETGSYALCLLDLNGFKRVNDEQGHLVGDEVLRHVAGHLRQAARPADVVARLGGDEFVVLLQDVASWAEVDPVVARLRAAVAVPMPGPDGPLTVTASIGVALASGVEHPTTVLVRADQLMYRDKRADRR